MIIKFDNEAKGVILKLCDITLKACGLQAEDAVHKMYVEMSNDENLIILDEKEKEENTSEGVLSNESPSNN